MRKFNNREKEIIKKLCEIALSDTENFSYFLQNKYFTNENNTALLILPKQDKAMLYIRKHVFDDTKSCKKEIGEFLELISLIMYLKESRYINIFHDDKIFQSETILIKESFNALSSDNPPFFKLNNDGDYINMHNISFVYNKNGEVIYEAKLLDLRICELMKINFFGILYVTEELIYLSKNDFISEEESRFRTQSLDNDKKFKKQQFVTWVSIILSALFAFYGIAYQIYLEKSQEKEAQKDDETQKVYLNNITNSLNSIKNNTELQKQEKQSIREKK